MQDADLRQQKEKQEQLATNEKRTQFNILRKQQTTRLEHRKKIVEQKFKQLQQTITAVTSALISNIAELSSAFLPQSIKLTREIYFISSVVCSMIFCVSWSPSKDESVPVRSLFFFSVFSSNEVTDFLFVNRR